MFKKFAPILFTIVLLMLAFPAAAQNTTQTTLDCSNLAASVDTQLAQIQMLLGAGDLAGAIAQIASLRQQLAACEGPGALIANATPEAATTAVAESTSEATPSSGKPGSGAVVSQADPCTVSTTNSDVAMRVGPGTNRGVRSAFPVNVNVPVVGQAEADDGSLWWK